MGPALDRGVDEGGPALGGRGALEPVARARGERVVPRAGLVERTQGDRDGRRLAPRTAAVGLERVAEAAVAVGVGGDGVADGLRRAVLEEPLEAAAVEHAGVAGEEVLGGGEVGGHGRDPITAPAGAS